MSKPVVISTFSGPGGSSLGYKRAGFDVRVALDNAPDGFSNKIIPTYTANHPDTTHIPQDARETKPEQLLQAADLEVGELDLLDGSPPCSPFSGANAQVDWGDHKSGTLFDTYTYFVDELEPKTFVAENVPDLAQGKAKGYFKQLYQNLTNAGPGYSLNVQKIDAAYLGAPHHRRRLIFIGVRNDIGEPPEIKPNKEPTTVKEAWKDLEQSDQAIRKAREKAERAKSYRWIKQLPPDRKTSTDMIRTDGKTSGFTQYRLSYTKPANTFTHARKDFIHPSEDRFLTIPEIKRLAGLPDDYHVENWETVIRTLPPILMETIGRRIKNDVL